MDIDIDLTICDLSSPHASERQLETATITFEEARKIFTGGWSRSILFKELSQSYERLAAGQEPCARSKGDGRLSQ